MMKEVWELFAAILKVAVGITALLTAVIVAAFFSVGFALGPLWFAMVIWGAS